MDQLPKPTNPEKDERLRLLYLQYIDARDMEKAREVLLERLEYAFPSKFSTKGLKSGGNHA